MSPSAPRVAEPVEGPRRCTSTITSGISEPMAKERCSEKRLIPGPLVAVMAFQPAMEAPMQQPRAAISSSACTTMPPSGGRMRSMVL